MSGADLDLARTAVAEAGSIAMRHFRQNFERWEKSPGQIVTEADLAVDEAIKARLLGARPADGWLSEETPDGSDRLARERVWVVDPIDGTRSFAAGVAEFTISIALVREGRPVLGVLLNPATGDLFEAVSGKGARRNGETMTASRRADLEGARILCSSSENRRRRFDRLLPRCEVASIGSLALKLAVAATGAQDGYLTWRRTHDWDVAAAALIIEEAGGRIGDASGAPLRFNAALPWHEGILAAGAGLYGSLLEATAAAHAGHLARRNA